MNPWLLSIPTAYLLGSIPFGYILIRFFLHRDIRDTGSGATGATNVAREAKGLGIVTLILDLLKAVTAVLIAFQIAAHYAPWQAMPRGIANLHAFDLATLAGVFVILGHCFPVWLGFRGGKGVASALGVFLTLVPLAAGGILIVFAIIFAITRYVSFASILAACAFPIFGFMLIHHPSPIVTFGFLFIPALIVFMHRSNIARLLAHTEPRMGSKKVAA